MANRYFTQFFNSLHKAPVHIDLQFTFLSTAGSGISNLKGGGVASVIALSSSPAAGNNMVAGMLQVTLQDNYFGHYNSIWGIEESSTGANVNATALVVGTPYVITTMGTTTQAGWVTAGLSPNVVAQPGVGFVAKAVTTGSGIVKGLAASGIYTVEEVGSPNLMVKGAGPLPGGVLSNGGVILLAMRNASAALTNPPDGAVMRLSLILSNSSLNVNGN